MAEEQDPGNKEAGERFTTPEQELRRSTKGMKLPQRFKNFATMSIKDPQVTEEAMSSCDEEN